MHGGVLRWECTYELKLFTQGERLISHLKTDFEKKKIKRDVDEQSIPWSRSTTNAINTVL